MKLYSRQPGTDAELAVYNWLEYTQFLGEVRIVVMLDDGLLVVFHVCDPLTRFAMFLSPLSP